MNRPGSLLLRVAARIVPAERRRSWRLEWEAEIAYAWRRLAEHGAAKGWALLKLRLRVASCLIDALWERRQAMRLKFVLERTGSDLKHALRSLARSPGFTIPMILTLALGVGIDTSVYSVTDAILLRPLPYRDPGRLVRIDQYVESYDRLMQNWPMKQAITLRMAAADALPITVYAHVSFVRTDLEDPRTLYANAVTCDWLNTLGVSPRLGRSFSAAECAAGGPRVVMVTESYWRRNLGADRSALGSTISLNGVPYTLVGVMPSSFKFPEYGEAQAWIPMASDGSIAGRTATGPQLVARLPDGMTVKKLQQRLDALGAGLAESDPNPRGWKARASEFGAFRANPDVRKALVVLSGAALIILLIAVVNAAGLILVRNTAREHEISVRAALGASRGTLTGFLLSESALLAFAGGGLAVLLTYFVLPWIVRLFPSEVSFFLTSPAVVDHRVVLFALAATVTVTLLLAFFPNVHLLRGSSLKPATADSSSVRRGEGRTRGALIFTEITLSTGLLVGACLLLSSFVRLTAVNPGYDADHLVQLRVTLPSRNYPDAALRKAFMERLRARVEALSAVAGASLVQGTPVGGGMFTFGIEPRPEGGEPKKLDVDLVPALVVDTRFFTTAGIPILAGRGFDEQDTYEGGNVVIDRDFAHFLWGSESPIGRRFQLDPSMDEWLTVVGTVGDVKLWGQDDRRARYDLFRPGDSEGIYLNVLLARTIGDPEPVLAPIRQVLRDMDRQLPAADFMTVGRALSNENDKARFLLVLVAVLTTTAVLLAAVGNYGVMSFSVGRRKRELAIRSALGADARALKGMVLRRGLALGGAGIAAGVAVAEATAPMLGNLLFGVEPMDPASIVAAAALMLIISAAACWFPARRATRMDPMSVMRQE